MVTDRVYLTLDERRRLQERRAREQFNGLVAELIDRGLAAAKPVAERWWRETALPAVRARRTKMLERRALRRERKAHKPAEAAVTETAVAEPAQGLAEHSEQNGPAMSRAEAQSRFLAALAARAYSEEQMRLVAEACIVDGDGEPTRSLAELQPEQVRAAIEAMASNPALLGEDNLAQLASILARHVVRDQVEPRRRDVARSTAGPTRSTDPVPVPEIQ